MSKKVWLPGVPGNPRPRPQAIQCGHVRWRLLDHNGDLIWDRPFKNAATTAGLNHILDVGFNAGSQITTWYIGLINGSGFSAVAAADTPASHTGWTEFTDFSGNRKAWSPGTISGGSLPTGTASSFVMTSSGSVRGIFIVSVATKEDTTGTLWATAIESSNRSVANGQTLQVFYTNAFTPVS